MARRIIWSDRAITDLESIAEYISRDAPSYARGVVRRIVGATQRLKKFPASGRKVPEDESLREVIVSSYRVVYRVSDDEIGIAAILHGKQTFRM